MLDKSERTIMKTDIEQKTKTHQRRAVPHELKRPLVHNVRAALPAHKRKIARTSRRHEVVQQKKRQRAPEALGDTQSAKSSFRIDLYARDSESGFTGKIQSVLTEESKNLSGFDKEAIIDFIAARLPKIKEISEKTRTRKAGTLPAEQTKAAQDRMNVSVVPTGSRFPTRCLKHDKPYDINITFEPNAPIFKQPVGVSYTITVQARPLEGGTSRILSTQTGLFSVSRSFTLHVQPKTVARGFHYLITQLTVQREKSGDPPLRMEGEEFAIDVI
jgi:hypothetical protein